MIPNILVCCLQLAPDTVCFYQSIHSLVRIALHCRHCFVGYKRIGSFVSLVSHLVDCHNWCRQCRKLKWLPSSRSLRNSYYDQSLECSDICSIYFQLLLDQHGNKEHCTCDRCEYDWNMVVHSVGDRPMLHSGCATSIGPFIYHFLWLNLLG